MAIDHRCQRSLEQLLLDDTDFVIQRHRVNFYFARASVPVYLYQIWYITGIAHCKLSYL